MSLIPPQRVLHTIVRITRTQCVAVAANEYEELVECENIQWDNIEKWIFSARNSNLNRGGLSVSAAN